MTDLPKLTRQQRRQQGRDIQNRKKEFDQACQILAGNFSNYVERLMVIDYCQRHGIEPADLIKGWAEKHPARTADIFPWQLAIQEIETALIDVFTVQTKESESSAKEDNQSQPESGEGDPNPD